MWCVNAVAVCHFTTGSFVPQKLALAFHSLRTLTDSFPTDSVIRLIFVWPALLSAGHRNQGLRDAGIRFLGCVILRVVRSAHLDALAATRTSSEIAVNRYEQSLRVSFVTNYPYALSLALTRGFEDAETRNSALECLAKCVCATSGAIDKLYYPLPSITFAQDDRQGIVENGMAEECRKFPQFVFRRFEQ
jgi:hypothetical protein